MNDILKQRPSDTEIVNFLASLWDSQGTTPVKILGRDFENVTGSFRDAIAAQMKTEDSSELETLQARIAVYEKEIRELKERENARNLAELKFTHQGPPEGYIPPKPEIPQNLRLPEDGGTPKPVRPPNIQLSEGTIDIEEIVKRAKTQAKEVLDQFGFLFKK